MISATVHKYSIIVVLITILLVSNVSAAVPEADFEREPSIGPVPLQVNFTDTSTNSPTGWTWFFGDELWDQTWTQVNASSGWAARSSFSAVAMPDGSIVLMGGKDAVGAKNDTWRSTNNGTSWTEINSSSGWSARYGHSATVTADGKIILTGGYNPITLEQSDTWMSINNGTSWTQVNASGGWGARTGHAMVKSTGSDYLFITGGTSADTYENDTWRSINNGSTWTLMNLSSGWSPRYGHTMIIDYDEVLILIGGNNGTSRLNEVWTSDDSGGTWLEVAPTSGWTPRDSMSGTFISDSSIVLMGGESDAGYRKEVWRSTNSGGTWTQLNAPAWDARNSSSVVYLPNGKLVLMGGYNNTYKNDTWVINPVGSSEQNPIHTYTEVGDYIIRQQAFNSEGMSMYPGFADLETTPLEGPGWHRRDIVMDQGYLLNLTFRSSTTLASIMNVSIIDNYGLNTSITNGVFTNSYSYGIATLIFSSSNYSSRTIQFPMNADLTDIVYLDPIQPPMNVSNIRQTTYFPHLVRITCQDYLGSPIADMNVSVVVVESTAPYAWLSDIFGIDTNQTEIVNTTLAGSTDSGGAIVFMMVEDLKYQVQFTKPSQSISQTNYLYPKEGEYTYVFWSELPPSVYGTVSITFWNRTNATNASYMDLGVQYIDTGATTDHLEMTVYHENETSLLYRVSPTPNSWNTSFPVLMSSGTAYIWGVRANNTRFEQQITSSQVIRFGFSPSTMPFTLCPGEDYCIWNQWIALGIIFLVGMLFGRATIKYASAIVVLLTLFFAYVGWLHYEWILISTIMFFGILFYVRYADQESDM